VSRIIFSISKIKQNEWFNYLRQNQINFPSSVYVKKIGYVSSDTLKIKIKIKIFAILGLRNYPKNLIIVFQVTFKYEKHFSTIKIFKILSYVRNSWNRFF